MAVVVYCAVFLTPAAVAGGNPAEHSSRVKIQGIHTVDPNRREWIVFGLVSSASKHCVAHRTVHVYFKRQTGPFVKVDTARTSNNGAWAARAKIDSTSEIKAVVTQSAFGPKRHRQTCGAATSGILHLA
jgi:hypothetical protein